MLELNSLDKFKHKVTKEVVTYICRSHEDPKILIVYVDDKYIAREIPESKFLREFYNISEPEFENE